MTIAGLPLGAPVPPPVSPLDLQGGGEQPIGEVRQPVFPPTH
jgi:hypothetical protein